MIEIRKKLWLIILQNGSDFINIHKEFYMYHIISRYHKFLYNTRHYVIIRPPKEIFMRENFENTLIKVFRKYIEGDMLKFDRWIENNHELEIPINDTNIIKVLLIGGYII